MRAVFINGSVRFRGGPQFGRVAQYYIDVYAFPACAAPMTCGKPRAQWARGFCLPLEIRKACLGGGLCLACRRRREAMLGAKPVMRLKRRAQATSRRLAPAPWKVWEGPEGASPVTQPWSAGPEGLLPGEPAVRLAGKLPLSSAPCRAPRPVGAGALKTGRAPSRERSEGARDWEARFCP